MGTIVLDKDGQFLSETNRNGKIRHLLKEKRAKIVKNDPFTIQLLEDFDFLEDQNMKNIIVSNGNIPVEFDKTNTILMRYHEFMYKFNNAETRHELESTIVYINVDIINDDDVFMFNSNLTEQLNMTVKYFMFNPSEEVDPKDILIFTPRRSIKNNINYIINAMLNLDLKLSKKINMSIGNILVVGNVGSGKTTLLKNLAIQAYDKKMKVQYLTPTTMEDIPNIQVDKVDIKQCASIVGDFYQEMMERYSEMTKRGSSSYVDLDVKPLLLIIDNLDILLQSDKYQYIDTIKNKLDSIARLGRNAGIKFIISSQTVEGIPITLREFCPHKIIVGNANSNTFEELFKSNEILQVPSGTGIYKYNNENMVTFIINDVADY